MRVLRGSGPALHGFEHGGEQDQKRTSGPLLDRIDIHVEVPRVEYEKLSESRLGEAFGKVRTRIEAARERQRARFGIRSRETSDSIACNADMHPAEVQKFCVLDETGQALMQSALNQLQLSARGVTGRSSWRGRC